MGRSAKNESSEGVIQRKNWPPTVGSWPAEPALFRNIRNSRPPANTYEHCYKTFLFVTQFRPIYLRTRMGTAASQEEENKVGYRVLGVLPDSPASKASLVSFFDFLGTLNQCPFERNHSLIVKFNQFLRMSIVSANGTPLNGIFITILQAWF